MARNLRNLAARVLLQVRNGQSLAAVMPAALAEVADRDRALLQQLCYGALRLYPQLEWVLSQLLDKPLNDQEQELRQLLLLGLYQLHHTRIPAHAAISETVSAVAALGKPWAKGLCNAILRSAQRRADDLNAAIAADAKVAAAHPAWLRKKLSKAWPERWQAICAENNAPAPMTLRINTRVQSRDTYLAALQQAGIEATPCAHSAAGITLDSPCDVNALPGFASGALSVQDEAAQLCGALLAPQPGEHILDACAAPGGKTCHLLEQTDNRLDLLALDADAGRLARVQENLDRLHLDARCVAADAGALEPWWDGKAFDRILLDAPCSATGVIRRHPDIKLLRKSSDIPALVELQGRILRNLWQTLKPGGRLLYATCSVLPDENAGQIEAFLAETADATLVPIAAAWGLDTGFGRQLLPQGGGHDGFFYALLQKAG